MRSVDRPTCHTRVVDRVLNQISSHWRVRSRTSSAVVAAASGALIGLGLSSSAKPLRFVAGWAGSALAIGSILDYGVRGQKEVLDDNRKLWALAPGIVGSTPIRPLGGWALGPGAVAFVAQWVAVHQSRTLVELGPGASTVALDRLLPATLQMWGVEHDAAFANAAAELFAYSGTREVTLIHAPLIDGWYDTKLLNSQLPPQIDVLIVDGPPNLMGNGNRRPALLRLHNRLSPGALILVDDTARRDERKMATEWAREYKLRVVHRETEFLAFQAM